MEEDKGLHTGHRERMMGKFSKNGIDIFEDHEKLEVLLYQILPRINTNVIAHNLINYFGSLKSVLLAPVDELAKVKGIGEKSALQLKFIGDLTNYLNEAKAAGRLEFTDLQESLLFFREHFKNKTDEVFTLLLLDDKCTMLQCCDICSSQPNHIRVDYREISKLIIRYDAYKLIIAHNHIIGTTEPSDDDRRFTNSLYDYLKMIGVGLIDHIIVCENDVLSMRNNGYLGNIWDV